jgi:ATP-dependent DNA ligase
MTATGNPVSHDHIREIAQEIQNSRVKRIEDAGGPVKYNPPIGKLCAIKFQELSTDGIPRFPVYISIRDYE